MKRRFKITMVLAILSAFFLGCSNNTDKFISNNNIIGNDTNNISYGGRVAKQGEWVFYYKPGGIFGIGGGL